MSTEAIQQVITDVGAMPAQEVETIIVNVIPSPAQKEKGVKDAKVMAETKIPTDDVTKPKEENDKDVANESSAKKLKLGTEDPVVPNEVDTKKTEVPADGDAMTDQAGPTTEAEVMPLNEGQNAEKPAN